MEKAIILDELKPLLQYKFGINTLTPSDCKFIANEIKKLTQKNISETTIKRIFGFASVKYNFSRYTLALLSDFSDEIKKQLNSICWEASIEKTRRTIGRALLSTKNTFLIPDKHTITRKFSEEHFDSFLNSRHNFTCFMSQTGYERTALFAQLAGRFRSTPTHRFSSLLFLNSYHFLCDEFGVLNIASCIKNELGIDQASDLIEYINNRCKKSNSSLVIFIDDFNDPDIKSHFRKHLFERLHDFIEEIENSYIKLVISMRSVD